MPAMPIPPPIAPTRRHFLAGAAAAAASALPVSAASRRPNILFFFPDQHRFDWTGLNKAGLDVRTPNLNSLAARGVEFTRAVVASPLCAPSRACLASGKEYDRCGVRNNGFDYPVEQPTYYAALRESGYHTMVCGKVDLHKKSFIWGVDGKHSLKEWGFSDGIDNAGKGDAISSGAVTPKDPYMYFLHQRGLAAQHVADFRKRSGHEHYRGTWPTPLPEDAYCDNWVGENGLRLLRAAPGNTPWHLVINFVGPHSPLDITSRMEPLARGRNYPQPNRNDEFDPETHVRIRQNYTVMVENLDRWLGVYLEELKKRGELDNTVIVWSSDHGEMLGDHNRWSKSVPYQPSVGVPLVAAGPGIEGGRKSDALVSHIDLGATFLDLAQARPLHNADSRSLAPILRGKAKSHRQFVRSGLNDWRMAWDGRWKLITGFDPAQRGNRPRADSAPATPPLLFDLQSDPAENNNAAAANPAVVERLKKVLV